METLPCRAAQSCPQVWARQGAHLAGMRAGWLGHGLAAEEIKREGAEEGRDAVLAQQVQLDELPHGA